MAQLLDPYAIKGGNGNSPRHPGGRPVKLDFKRFLRVCALVERGLTNTQACQAEGVNYSGFRSHVRRKPWWAKRFQHADQIRDEYLRDFHLANITKHAKGYQDGETFVRGSWAASAWILERKFPNLFALHYTQHRTADANTNRFTPSLPGNNSWPASNVRKSSRAKHRLGGKLSRTPRLPANSSQSNQIV